MRQKVTKTVNKARVAQDLVIKAATRGRLQAPRRGSLGNKLAWAAFWLMLPFFLYYLYVVLKQKGLL